jgi:hypothetical protein
MKESFNRDVKLSDILKGWIDIKECIMYKINNVHIAKGFSFINDTGWHATIVASGMYHGVPIQAGESFLNNAEGFMSVHQIYFTNTKTNGERK